jgi:S1-C subfamily serine protease
VLPRLKAGKDLRHGVLGITMQGDEFTAAPTVATVTPSSPAEKAGIKPGDVIVAVDGKPVGNHAQLRHRLGPKYEGDTVSVTLKRGKDEVKVDKVALTAAAAGTGQPFLGILPVRDDPGPGVEVRYVYPGSPAEKAGIKPGDRVMKVGRSVGPGQVVMQPVVARDALLALLDVAPPGCRRSCRSGPAPSLRWSSPAPSRRRRRRRTRRTRRTRRSTRRASSRRPRRRRTTLTGFSSRRTTTRTSPTRW